MSGSEAVNRRQLLRRFSVLSAGGIATPVLAQLDYLIRRPVSVVMPLDGGPLIGSVYIDAAAISTPTYTGERGIFMFDGDKWVEPGNNHGFVEYPPLGNE